jgi:hypothetical protein
LDISPVGRLTPNGEQRLVVVGVPIQDTHQPVLQHYPGEGVRRNKLEHKPGPGAVVESGRGPKPAAVETGDDVLDDQINRLS